VDRYQTHLANFTLANSASTQSGEEQGKELALNTWLVTTRQGREHEVGFWIDTSINPLASYRFEDYFSTRFQEVVRIHLLGRFQTRHFGEDLFTTCLNFTTRNSVWQKVSGFDGYIFTTNFEVISEEGTKRQRYKKRTTYLSRIKGDLNCKEINEILKEHAEFYLYNNRSQ